MAKKKSKKNAGASTAARPADLVQVLKSQGLVAVRKTHRNAGEKAKTSQGEASTPDSPVIKRKISEIAAKPKTDARGIGDLLAKHLGNPHPIVVDSQPADEDPDDVEIVAAKPDSDDEDETDTPGQKIKAVVVSKRRGIEGVQG